MMVRMTALAIGAIGVLTVLNPAAPARAGNFSSHNSGNFSARFGGGKDICLPSRPTIFNKTLNFNKNITINKPVTITNNINIEKHIDLSKHINIEKNIDLSKHIEINKKIIINKNNGNAEAFATAFAFAQARADASAFSYARSGSSYVTIMNKGGEISQIAVAPPEQPCVQQWASLIKAVHAECIDKIGERHPATRMIPQTWIDSSESKEIFRCLEGSTLKVIIGDVLQSDQGVAGVYQGGRELACGAREALRHFRDGLVKCAEAEKVPDCTERTNLRKYGLGDVFFTYQAQVCVRAAEIAETGYSYGYSSGGYSTAPREVQLSGMSLDGGVGQ